MQALVLGFNAGREASATEVSNNGVDWQRIESRSGQRHL